MDIRPLNVLSVCSGVGSLDLGIRIACPEARTVCYLEREAFACEILATRMQQGCLDDAPIWSDIGTFEGRAWRGVVDLVIAGLPCQPYSVAGKRKGDGDDRYLWPSFFKIIRDVQPSMVFLENVPGLLQWFRPIGDELSGMGYRFEAGLFSASEVGASQRRERWFCLAYAARNERGGRERQGGTGRGVRKDGGALADTGRKRIRGRVRVQPGGVGPEAGTTQGDSEQRQRMRDASGDGCSPVEQAKHGRPDEQESRAEPWGAGRGNMGHSNRTGRTGRTGERGDDGTQCETDKRASGDGMGKADFGPFAPGPSDPRWREIIDADPWLAPAIEPGLCVLANGLAATVDESRVDQLRAVGNGVVPLTAAKAFRVLAQRLTGGFLEEER